MTSISAFYLQIFKKFELNKKILLLMIYESKDNDNLLMVL